VKCHSSSLGDKIIPNLNPTYEIQWKEEEELQCWVSFFSREYGKRLTLHAVMPVLTLSTRSSVYEDI